MKVIAHFLFIWFVTFILNILGDISYTDTQEVVLGIYKAVACRGMFLGQIEGS